MYLLRYSQCATPEADGTKNIHVKSGRTYFFNLIWIILSLEAGTGLQKILNHASDYDNDDDNAYLGRQFEV
jgi:hypothetical protein